MPVADVDVPGELLDALSFAFGIVWRYFRRGGGLAMLRMMGEPMPPEHAHV